LQRAPLIRGKVDARSVRTLSLVDFATVPDVGDWRAFKKSIIVTPSTVTVKAF